ncbi:MAG TPA: hypothetical protein VMF13_06895 [Luteitalea sp.]|nr:hypothetical protein [Luteitalea sp.]
MTVGRWLTAAVFLGVLTTTPVLAQEGRSRGGDRGDRGGGGRGEGSTGRQAVPRGGYDGGGRSYGGQRGGESPRTYAAPPRTEGRSAGPRDYPSSPRHFGSPGVSRGPMVRQEARPDGGRGPAYVRPRYDDRNDGRDYRDRGYVGRAVPRAYADRRYVAPPRVVSPRYYGGVRGGYGYGYGSRVFGNPRYYHYAPGYGAPGWRGGWGRTIIVPRYIHPRILGYAPYRPYYYRPSIAMGVYYGTDDLYPFGSIPNYYYDPGAGSSLGGVRITDAPRDAQVFADGYYAGIVDDFDGFLQHLNLEPGPHRLEIHTPGSGAISFDVVVQPGRTITLRADVY